MPKSRVLLTGANGFTGKYLNKTLFDRGYEVIALDCDLTNQKAVLSEVANIKPDYVIHLAAIAFVASQDNEAFYRVNLFGTLNLLEAIAQHNSTIQKTIVVSSANVYGNPKVNIINETVCPSPINHYAVSKLAMESMVKPWFEKLPIIITRPFNYTGPGQAEHFLLPKIVKHFAEKKHVISLGNIDVIRDFSDIGFITEAYCRLLECKQQSEIYNLCSGIGYSIHDVLNIMQEISGYKIAVDTHPDLVRSNEIKILIGDNHKLFQAVDTIQRVPLKITLQKMYQYFLDNHASSI